MPGEEAVRCSVCPHGCLLSEGVVGRCRARTARNGASVPLNYGKITSIALDPIEKKPLAAFHPGSAVLSVGSFGCNLSCPFCQNDAISQAGEHDVPWREITPSQLVEHALALRGNGCMGIAYTYNEPLVGYEFVRDCARLAHDRGLVNVLVSNGMANSGPLSEIVPLIDAANIDLKGFTQGFYDLVGGSLAAVKGAIDMLASAPNCHLEVTTLVIPGLNDDPAEIASAAEWIASLDSGIVYHLTRFFPRYRMTNVPMTRRATLEALREAAMRHLPNVVLGNC